ncbi:rhodanese-like domain-containing protein [Sphingobium sp. AN558]|uniref:rhodanese-like domain-containing protein n=1 Tax=Sphingobium sp. AN558 TaxID=3133442 RepID=UPI0030C49FD8
MVEGGIEEAVQAGPWTPTLPPIPDVDAVSVDELAQSLESGSAVLIDLAPSLVHRAGHIPGARFAIRAQLDAALATLGDDAAIVLTSPDGALAAFAAADGSAGARVRVLKGGTAAWVAAGRSLEPGFDQPLTLPDDVYKRPYVGTDNAAEKMQAYLDWEYGLVDQLKRDGTHGFVVI